MAQSNWNEIVDSFDDMNLSEALLRGIYAYGFEKPSAIQQRAILPCIKGPAPHNGHKRPQNGPKMAPKTPPKWLPKWPPQWLPKAPKCPQNGT